ncbi:MAG: hypothetical protein O2800_02440 [Planctomycetota bacterium]|nr:hypothetical protein [Planctomycetota bacterium]
MNRHASHFFWGLVLTSSWTWCIGLYLPVILMRLFGWEGFLAFAIPNVIGCALFGFIVNDERGARMRARWHNAIRVFALWTIGYQVFFLLWFMGDRSHVFSVIEWIFVVAGVYSISRLRSEAWWMVLAVIGAALALFASMSLSTPLTAVVEKNPPLLGAEAAWWGAPLMALGFLLCPLLDPTFHWVRQRAQSPAPFAWFGLFFAGMLALSASYASDGILVLTSLVAAHIIFQLFFTASLQWRACDGQGGRPNLGLFAVLIATLFGWIASRLAFIPALSTETIPNSVDAVYLVLLGAYGVLFPVWVLVGGRGRDLAFWIALIPAALLAGPGFLGGDTRCLFVAALWILLVFVSSSKTTPLTARA